MTYCHLRSRPATPQGLRRHRFKSVDKPFSRLNSSLRCDLFWIFFLAVVVVVIGLLLLDFFRGGYLRMEWKTRHLSFASLCLGSGLKLASIKKIQIKYFVETFVVFVWSGGLHETSAFRPAHCRPDIHTDASEECEETTATAQADTQIKINYDTKYSEQPANIFHAFFFVRSVSPKLLPHGANEIRRSIHFFYPNRLKWANTQSSLILSKNILYIYDTRMTLN